MALIAKLLVAQRAFIEALESRIITLSNGGIIQSENFQEGQSGFRIKHDGDTEFNNGKFRGRIDADSGTFCGELESGPLKVNTETLYSSDWRNHNGGKAVDAVMNEEFALWGYSPMGGNNPITVGKPCRGTYGSTDIVYINIFYQGRAGIANISGITLTYSDGSTSGLIPRGGTLPQNLSFRYSTQGWSIRIEDIDTADPKIPGVVWRDGTNLKISTGQN